jgi:hypothetical protein
MNTSLHFALTAQVKWEHTASRFLKQDSLFNSERGTSRDAWALVRCMAVLSLKGACDVALLCVHSQPRNPLANPNQGMSVCAAKGPGGCGLAACHPCYCGGLAAVEPSFAGDGEWLDAAKKACSPYIDAFDVRSTAVRSVISCLIVLINYVLTVLLQVVGGGTARGALLVPAFAGGGGGSYCWGGQPRAVPHCRRLQTCAHPPASAGAGGL